MSSETLSVSNEISWLERNASVASRWLLDLIFPPACGNCGRVDFGFCSHCLAELKQSDIEASPGASDVPDELNALIATGKHRGVLQKAVQSFKYNGARELAAPLANRLARALLSTGWGIDAVVPVPLFADREAERGYNQSALLSMHLAALTGFAHSADSLKRNRATGQQAQLSGVDRRLNVRDAFEARAEVMGLSILLVDDVVTTGSTLSECALALKAKGARAVYGIAVSHA